MWATSSHWLYLCPPSGWRVRAAQSRGRVYACTWGREGLMWTVIPKVCVHANGKTVEEYCIYFTSGLSRSCLIIQCLVSFEEANPKEHKHLLDCWMSVSTLEVYLLTDHLVPFQYKIPCWSVLVPFRLSEGRRQDTRSDCRKWAGTSRTGWEYCEVKAGPPPAAGCPSGAWVVLVAGPECREKPTCRNPRLPHPHTSSCTAVSVWHGLPCARFQEYLLPVEMGDAMESIPLVWCLKETVHFSFLSFLKKDFVHF